MAALVGIAADFGALAAAHVAFEFMDRRCLRSPHDVEATLAGAANDNQDAANENQNPESGHAPALLTN